ncbi:hypothetical protein EXIGLDRAFT_364505 [Exidia glandulosa HHB12029]|uniref:Uncharacterized protein n=1 Tax=Exidia glandulosa HHB12029 TaxID=1314781 RepID=A0A165C4C5_EXIGL|nr:hypothetical protein EXIGLDRAFT_364505 [Exidia glandulosa HHB12029]
MPQPVPLTAHLARTVEIPVSTPCVHPSSRLPTHLASSLPLYRIHRLSLRRSRWSPSRHGRIWPSRPTFAHISRRLADSIRVETELLTYITWTGNPMDSAHAEDWSIRLHHRPLHAVQVPWARMSICAEFSMECRSKGVRNASGRGDDPAHLLRPASRWDAAYEMVSEPDVSGVRTSLPSSRHGRPTPQQQCVIMIHGGPFATGVTPTSQQQV